MMSLKPCVEVSRAVVTYFESSLRIRWVGEPAVKRIESRKTIIVAVKGSKSWVA
jgi:hypothetical protein